MSAATDVQENTIEPAEETVPNTPPVQLRRSTRHSTPPLRLTYIHPEEDETNEGPVAMIAGQTGEPASFQDATSCAEKSLWKTAIEAELSSYR